MSNLNMATEESKPRELISLRIQKGVLELKIESLRREISEVWLHIHSLDKKIKTLNEEVA